MAVDYSPCIRCKGKGKVKIKITNSFIEIIEDILYPIISIFLFMPLFTVFYGIIAGIIGSVYFVLLKTTLSFYVFGAVFYFMGGFFLTKLISSFLFKIKESQITNIIYILVGFGCTYIGRYFCLNKGVLIVIGGLLYSYILGFFLGAAYSLAFKKGEDVISQYTTCPLCDGKKVYIKTEYKRCEKCNENCGYENSFKEGISRGFCGFCSGRGYNKII